jgi:hypothetical protein
MLLQTDTFNFLEIGDDKIDALVEGKFVIVLDFDGVITSPYVLKTQYLNQLGYRISESECSALSCLKRGIPKKDHDYATLHAFTTEPEHLPLEKDFLFYFKKLKNLKHVAFFVLTSRTDNMLEHLKSYLAYHSIRVDGVVHTNNKNKTAYLARIKSSIFVDDTPFKLWQIICEDKNFLKRSKLILYRNIQNASEKNPSREIIEVDAWKTLFDIILNEYTMFIARNKT